MNTLLLYIQVKNNPLEVKYKNPLHDLICEEGWQNEYESFDIDNHTESIILNQLKGRIATVPNIFVLIEADSDANLGGVGNIISILADKSSKVNIRLEGSHPILEKYMSVFSYQKSVINTYEIEKIETILDKIYPK